MKGEQKLGRFLRDPTQQYKRKFSGGRLVSKASKRKRCLDSSRVVIFWSHPTCWGWHFCDAAAPCIYPLTYLLATPIKKIHWLTKLDIEKVMSFFCCWLLFCIEWTCVYWLSPGKVSYTINVTLPGMMCPLIHYLYGITNPFLIVFEVCVIGQTLYLVI